MCCCSIRGCGASLLSCFITYLCLPIALVVGIAAIIVFYVLDFGTYNQTLQYMAIALTGVVFITILFGICTSCCGFKSCKFVQAVLFTVISVFIIVVGSYILTYRDQFSELVRDAYEKNKDKEAVRKIIEKTVESAGCKSIDDPECDAILDKYGNKIFVTIGCIILVDGLIIILGALAGFCFACHCCCDGACDSSGGGDRGVSYR